MLIYNSDVNWLLYSGLFWILYMMTEARWCYQYHNVERFCNLSMQVMHNKIFIYLQRLYGPHVNKCMDTRSRCFFYDVIIIIVRRTSHLRYHKALAITLLSYFNELVVLLKIISYVQKWWKDDAWLCISNSSVPRMINTKACKYDQRQISMQICN